jgi:hypothetical protein
MRRRPQGPQTSLGDAIEAAIYLLALLGTLVAAVLDAAD